MRTTIELLDAAISKAESQAALCRELHISGATLTVARGRGRLSPTLAGQIAERIGAPVEHWVAVAALEAAPRSRTTDHLRKVLQTIAYP